MLGVHDAPIPAFTMTGIRSHWATRSPALWRICSNKSTFTPPLAGVLTKGRSYRDRFRLRPALAADRVRFSIRRPQSTRDLAQRFRAHRDAGGIDAADEDGRRGVHDDDCGPRVVVVEVAADHVRERLELALADCCAAALAEFDADGVERALACVDARVG